MLLVLLALLGSCLARPLLEIEVSLQKPTIAYTAGQDVLSSDVNSRPGFSFEVGNPGAAPYPFGAPGIPGSPGYPFQPSTPLTTANAPVTPLTAANAPVAPLTNIGSPGDIVSGPCKSYAIISARGTGETQVNPDGSRGLINSVLTAVPGGESYEVVYPASSNFLSDPETGAADMSRHIDAVLGKCPSQRVVYFGYSQGAMVIVNAMNNPSVRARAGNVRATIFYGNPYYRSNLPQDRGTATSGSGIGLLKNVVEASNEVPPEFVPNVRDFCNAGDPVCQGMFQLKLSDVGATLVGSPAFAEHHYNGKPAELEAIHFVVQQLQRS